MCPNPEGLLSCCVAAVCCRFALAASPSAGVARSCIRGPLYPPLPVDSERIDEDTGWNGGVGTTCRRHGLDLMVVTGMG